MTDLDTLIARVRELDAAATKGPWMLGRWFGQCKAKHTHRGPPERGGDCIYEYEWRPHTTDAEPLRCICAPPNLTLIQGNDWGPQPSRVDDAALIAYYRTACPLLAAECDRLRRALEDIASYEEPTFGEVALQVCLDMRDDAFDALKGTR